MTVLIRKTINERWSFPSGKYGERVVYDGLARLDDIVTLSESTIADYIAYQIYRYKDMIGSDKRWAVSWIFSKNAVDKYKKQFMSKDGKTGMRYFINHWLNENGLSMDKLADMLLPPKHSLDKYIYMESEEHVKGRFLGTQYGLMLCQLSTTGWSPLSATCSKCSNKEECISFFRERYPELLRLRENYGKKQ